jgi:hypothetical protein
MTDVRVQITKIIKYYGIDNWREFKKALIEAESEDKDEGVVTLYVKVKRL